MARDRTRIRQEPLIAFGVPVYGGALIPTMGQDWFVDPNADVFVPKKKWGTGKSDDRPFSTLAAALAAPVSFAQDTKLADGRRVIEGCYHHREDFLSRLDVLRTGTGRGPSPI